MHFLKMTIDKAVILARGLGKRMRKQAESLRLNSFIEEKADKGWKPFIPIGGRPFIDYQILELKDTGFRKVCLVVGREHLILKDHYQELGTQLGVEISLTIQEKPLGTADAVYASKNFVRNDSFIVLNGDNFYPREPLEIIKSQVDENRCYVIGFERESLIEKSNFDAGRIRSFSVMLVDDDMNLIKIVEKPDDPELYRSRHGILINMNLWRFTPVIFEACKRIKPHPERGEFELTSAVQTLVDEKIAEVKVLPVKSFVLDLTYRADIPIVEKLIKRFENELRKP